MAKRFSHAVWTGYCLVLVAFFTLVAPARAATTSISLEADTIAYYSDRFLVEADGHVRVSLADGTVIAGRAFSMDLKLNRYLVAGEVDLHTPAADYRGAGFANFLEFKRGYFVPVLSEPDRWTFLDGDYANPNKGRLMPGDAFALPDVSDSRPFLFARHAEINPKNFVLFKGVRVYTAGVYTPLPRYFLNFSPNPNFSQNSLNGATADVGIPFNGSPTSETTLHVRYDSQNHLYESLEQHFAGPNSYLVGSINPLTRPGKQYNVLAFLKTPNQRFQVRSFSQETTFQPALNRPLVASAYLNLQPTYAFKNSFLQLNVNQSYASLLSQPVNHELPNSAYYIVNEGARYYWAPQHPNDMQLSWIGADRRVWNLPLTLRTRSGIGMAHDVLSPLGFFVNTAYTSVFTKFAGLTLSSSSLKLADNTYFNGSYDHQRLWYSLPHFADQESTNLSISRLFGSKAAAFLAYRITNQKDIYGKTFQTNFYPVTVAQSPSTGQSYPGYAAFTGKATNRALVGSLILSPSPDFVVTLTGQRNKDFPAPVPQFFGQSPQSVTADVRTRLSKHLTLDIQRSYYFNFGSQGWSPTFQIQFGP